MVVAPWKRFDAEQALAHPYLGPYHDPLNEPVGAGSIRFDADAIERLPKDQLQDALLEEAMHFGGV